MHQSATSVLSESLVFECNSNSSFFKTAGFRIVENSQKKGFGFGKTWVENTSNHALTTNLCMKPLAFEMSIYKVMRNENVT